MSEITKIKSGASGENSKTGRQELIGGWHQDIVENATVLVVGAGAIGNEVIKNLALLGFSRVFIIDMDTISTSNLSRTVLFTADDLGKYKAKVAAERFQEMSVAPAEKIAVDYFIGDLISSLGQGVFRRCDVILGCLDNIYTRRNVNMRAAILQKPYLDAGISSLYSNLSVVHFPYTACLECGMDNDSIQQESIRRTSCDTYKFKAIQEQKVPTTQVTSALISALMCQEAVKVLHVDNPEEVIAEQNETKPKKFKIRANSTITGKHAPRLLPKYGCKYYFDGTNNTFSTFPIYQRESCFCQLDNYLDYAMLDNDIVETPLTNKSTVHELLEYLKEKFGEDYQLVLDEHPLDTESGHICVLRTKCRGTVINGQICPCDKWVEFGGKPRYEIYKEDCFCAEHIDSPHKYLGGSTIDETVTRFYMGMSDDYLLDHTLERLGFPKLAILTVEPVNQTDDCIRVEYIELTGDLEEVMPNLSKGI